MDAAAEAEVRWPAGGGDVELCAGEGPGVGSG